MVERYQQCSDLFNSRISKRMSELMLGASINSLAFPFSAFDLRAWLKPKGWQVFEWGLCLHPILEIESAQCGIEPKFKVH
jgi:hypothetical protein